MQGKSVLLALSTLGFSSALEFTNRDFDNIQPGVSFNITWSDAVDPVSLTLFEGGTPDYSKKVQTLASQFTPANI